MRRFVSILVFLALLATGVSPAFATAANASFSLAGGDV